MTTFGVSLHHQLKDGELVPYIVSSCISEIDSRGAWALLSSWLHVRVTSLSTGTLSSRGFSLSESWGRLARDFDPSSPRPRSLWARFRRSIGSGLREGAQAQFPESAAGTEPKKPLEPRVAHRLSAWF